jgi:hypothetical protein
MKMCFTSHILSTPAKKHVTPRQTPVAMETLFREPIWNLDIVIRKGAMTVKRNISPRKLIVEFDISVCYFVCRLELWKKIHSWKCENCSFHSAKTSFKVLFAFMARTLSEIHAWSALQGLCNAGTWWLNETANASSNSRERLETVFSARYDSQLCIGWQPSSLSYFIRVIKQPHR